MNLEDAFARLHLARLCAHVVHSDQSATDVSRDGAPFWQMLCLLAVRWVAQTGRLLQSDGHRRACVAC